MDEILRTDPERVVDIKRTDPPRRGLTATGYGGRIPMQWMLHYRGQDGRLRWHRVYAMVYGNSGAPYINADGGHRYHLDIDTEHRIESVKEGSR